MTTLEYYTPNKAEQRLINALRSGKFNQTAGALERITSDGQVSHCCLGVGCRVSSQPIKVESTLQHSKSSDVLTTFDNQRFYLPVSVAQELGWATVLGGIVEIPTQSEAPLEDFDGEAHPVASLAQMNDDGFTFDQIADVIEAGLVIRGMVAELAED